MPVTFHIPGPLQSFTNGLSRVEIDAAANTVGEALRALWGRHPGIRYRVVTEQGSVREHLNIFVGEECIRFTGGLETPLPLGSEIFILPALSGG